MRVALSFEQRPLRAHRPHSDDFDHPATSLHHLALVGTASGAGISRGLERLTLKSLSSAPLARTLTIKLVTRICGVVSVGGDKPGSWKGLV